MGNVEERRIDEKGRLWVDGKPVYGTFTIAEVEAAYGDIDELAREIRASGGIAVIGDGPVARHVSPAANVEAGPL